jgi:hypothetical protein
MYRSAWKFLLIAVAWGVIGKLLLGRWQVAGGDTVWFVFAWICGLAAILGFAFATARGKLGPLSWIGSVVALAGVALLYRFLLLLSRGY